MARGGLKIEKFWGLVHLRGMTGDASDINSLGMFACAMIRLVKGWLLLRGGVQGDEEMNGNGAWTIGGVREG